MPRRMRAMAAAAVAATAALTSGAFVAVGAMPAADEPTAATDPVDAEPQGATMPFVEYEAEAAATNGSPVGPDYTQGTVASEASGRQAVELGAAGNYVEFTLTEPANAVNVSYNVPDGSSGTLAVYVNGTKLDTPLEVTSKYSYVDTPWIQGSKTHHLFDNARLLLGQDLAVGDKVRFQVDTDNTAGPYTIDIAEFEQVATPASPPQGAISVVDKGADPTGAADSTNAFNQAITDAKSQGVEVWIPAGDFLLSAPLAVDQVTIRGAGNWHSVVHSSRFIDQQNASGNVGLHDFAVIGEVTERVDSSPDNFVNGSLGADSTVSGMWLQHLKVGLWLMGNNDNLVVENNRFLDMTADGLNLNGSANGVRVENNFLRNTGDDSLAMWALNTTNTGDSFIDNTIVQPNLANGIAIYGGTDITVQGNEVRDTNALGSGIAISNQKFLDPFFPLAGTVTVADNKLVRAGAMNPNWQHPMGALRVDSYNYAITDVQLSITNTTVLDSPYSAFEFVSGGGTGLAISGVSLDGATVDGVGTVVVQAETQGSVSFSNLAATNVGVAGVYNCAYPEGSGTFTVERGSGNSGWDSEWDGCDFPDPQ